MLCAQKTFRNVLQAFAALFIEWNVEYDSLLTASVIGGPRCNFFVLVHLEKFKWIWVGIDLMELCLMSLNFVGFYSIFYNISFSKSYITYLCTYGHSLKLIFIVLWMYSFTSLLSIFSVKWFLARIGASSAHMDHRSERCGGFLVLPLLFSGFLLRSQIRRVSSVRATHSQKTME